MNENVSLKKNTVLNVIKRLLQIAFPLITFPYISRVIGTNNFGKYNFSLSIISYFTLIAGIGVNTYAVREGARIRDDREKLEGFVSQVFTINLLFTILSYLLLLGISVLWTKLHDYWLLLFIQSTTILSITIGVDYINVIYEDYVYMTIRYISVKMLSLILMFALIHKNEDYVLYATIVTISEIVANVINVFYVRKYCSVRITKAPQVKKHLPALLILFADAFAITIYSNSDIIMLGVFSTDSTVGIYSLASKIYQIAKSVLNAVLVVMIPRLAWYLRNSNLTQYNTLLNKTLRAIITFITPAIVGIFMLSKQVIYIVGGDAYMEGVSSLRILLFALFPACIASIFFDGILIVNRKEKYCLISTLISASLNIVLNFLFVPLWGATGAAITTLIAEASNCVLCIYFSRKLHNMRILLDNDVYSVALGGISIVLVCIICNSFFTGLIYTVISIVFSAATYGFLLGIFKNSTFLIGMKWLKNVIKFPFKN